ncbi:MAG TPA: type I polyketide synthase, partial [Candidatus Eisenbacteria bacterium]|nr:type I polyketide synthase [Candidatus Eisenbacteria bacterium]
ALVLKPLARAVEDGDPVHCVILGSAVNHDGTSDGLTVPSARAQEQVIRLAYRHAHVDPASVQYVELHGTGTRIGDPVEAAALGAALGAYGPIAVGSAKTNVGHLEGAAGLVGLLKSSLCLRHREIPPSLHFETAHPRIPLDQLNLRVVRTLEPWPQPDEPLVAGVSSFGMGGTNCHLVLGAAPSRPPADFTDVHRVVPLLLSARSDDALRGLAARLSDPLGQPADVAYALATTRSVFDHRAVVIATSAGECRRALDAVAAGEPDRAVVAGIAAQPQGLAFLFSGQGSQRAGMGRGLYEAFPVFARSFDEICAAFAANGVADLRRVMFAAPGSPDAALLDETACTQPALFALETALFRLVEHWGLVPSHLVGHSIGELTAAHVAGVLSVEDACTLVAARGRLIQGLPTRGAMLAVEADEASVRAHLVDGGAEIAALNGPQATVVSGDEADVLRISEQMRAAGHRVRRLRVSHAFHSRHLDAMLDEFRAVAERLSYTAPRTPVLSNVTGQPADPTEICSAGYWVRHVRQAVRFADSVRWLGERGVGAYLELGPDGTLAALGRQCAGGVFVPLLGRVDVERDAGAEERGVVSALGRLHVAGVAVGWRRFFAGWPVR